MRNGACSRIIINSLSPPFSFFIVVCVCLCMCVFACACVFMCVSLPVADPAPVLEASCSLEEHLAQLQSSSSDSEVLVREISGHWRRQLECLNCAGQPSIIHQSHQNTLQSALLSIIKTLGKMPYTGQNFNLKAHLRNISTLPLLTKEKSNRLNRPFCLLCVFFSHFLCILNKGFDAHIMHSKLI